MTLHWWMHWFWITAFTITACIGAPALPTIQPDQFNASSPASELLDGDSPEVERNSNRSDLSSSRPLIVPPVRNYRGGKAIGQPPPNRTTQQPPHLEVSIAFPLAPISDVGDEGSALQKELSLNIDFAKPHPTADLDVINSTEIAEDKNITEVINPTDAVPDVSKNNNSAPKNASDDGKLSAVAPNDTSALVITQSTPVTKVINDTVVEEVRARDNATVKLPAKNNTTVVEVSTVRALSLETSVGRRAADVEVRKNVITDEEGGLDAGVVAGICFGSLVILGLAGATSLVLYRRRYLNKPQTLNDKCSNPDSSGYIDDSTIRENSEEMYSLDNDSFLNSLEAMTIQNYWTDSVKHTKL